MKRYLKKSFILFILISFAVTFLGCWDYQEMVNLKYLAGIAVDKDKYTNDYILTLEVLEASTNSKAINSNIIESRGKTIHAALRDAIKKTGNMLQGSHAKVLIVSKDIAEEGIVPVIDLINRDVQLRNDMWILISESDTASDILRKGKEGSEIISYELTASIANSNKIGKYMKVEIFKIISDISDSGSSAIAPMVNVDNKNYESKFEVSGTAIFRGEKVVGKLDGFETMFLQILKEENLKFVLPIELENGNNISLEIMNIDRSINPKIKDNKVVIDMSINIDTALSELASSEVNYILKDERDKLKKQSAEQITTNCYKVIEKLQNQYKSDAIGFGEVLKKKKPSEWREMEYQWLDIFEDIEVNLDVNVEIKYNGVTNKNIEVGD
ncbi:Ger(x)C family spore germination protein [Clostridium algidicarnis]|uniref:Ger(x)C family spore germination protein n=1 Tax=Clostridium algidicarnis TaxID=37659 RepID=UPI001C0DD09B|nr:Ger(x)C family spore germination protein [Clostridium algidicarnis]MBU3209511.1 Ger(x)C family spore germination protein [Clostridium algidicarnis]MBU3227234.1 Ger(x)C family spore germination protein [Clostridium algidicarnis]MBU3250758.1 Ger(x)C family spore germination protein [Clostridium algidicarnis]